MNKTNRTINRIREIILEYRVKRWHCRRFMLAIAAVAASLFLLRRGNFSSTAPGHDGQSILDFKFSKWSSGRSAAPTQNEAKTVNKIGLGSKATLANPGWQKLDLKLISEYVDNHRTDPVALAGFYSLSRSKDIQKNLLEMANKSHVAAAVLTMNAATPKEKLSFSRNLISMDSENSLGYLTAADASFRSGNLEEAGKYLDQALKAPKFDASLSEVGGGQSRAWAAAGMDEVDRGLLRAADPWRNQVINLVGYLSVRGMAGLEGDAAAAQASQFIQMIDKLSINGGDSMPISGTLQLLSMQMTVLQGMPPDFDIGDVSGQKYISSLAARTTELEQRRAKIFELMERSSPEINTQYFKWAELHGEESAALNILGVGKGSNNF